MDLWKLYLKNKDYIYYHQDNVNNFYNKFKNTDTGSEQIQRMNGFTEYRNQTTYNREEFYNMEKIIENSSFEWSSMEASKASSKSQTPLSKYSEK